MRKGERNSRHLEELERDRAKIYVYCVIIIILLFLISFLTIIYIKNESNNHLNFTETANIDYKVNLNKNDFFEKEYRESNKQYVSSLIKEIIANFNYEFNLSTDKKYNYTYRIDATTDIRDSKTKKSLYEETVTLIEKTLNNSSNKKISINEEINIDYNYYNNIATNFVKQYDLKLNSESTLNITMYVKTENTEESKVALSVPLVENTVAMNVQKELASETNSNALNFQNDKMIKYGTILGIITFTIGIGITIYLLIRYILDTRTEETIYKREKRKILMAYGGVIDKVDDYNLKLDEYHIIKLNKFDDLVRIKEDLSQPILMVENKDETNTMFFIPNNTKFIYMFVLNTHHELLAEKNEVQNETYINKEYCENVSGNENEE